MDFYTFPWFAAAENKSYFLTRIYICKLIEKLNPVLTQTIEITSNCRGICKNKTLKYRKQNIKIPENARNRSRGCMISVYIVARTLSWYKAT